MDKQIPPDHLSAIVDQLPDADEYPINSYADSIHTLHADKGLSFREIVEFLGRHGIATNRSAVHRVYLEYVENMEPESQEEADELRETRANARAEIEADEKRAEREKK